MLPWPYQACIYTVFKTGSSVSAQTFKLFIIFPHSRYRVGPKVEQRRKKIKRMITFGLNTAVSDFMTHHEGVVWR